jgi:hypothetical protein
LARAARRAKHRAITDAAAEGDRVTAAELLARHYLHTVRLVFAELDPRRDLARLRETWRSLLRAPSITCETPADRPQTDRATSATSLSSAAWTASVILR